MQLTCFCNSRVQTVSATLKLSIFVRGEITSEVMKSYQLKGKLQDAV